MTERIDEYQKNIFLVDMNHDYNKSMRKAISQADCSKSWYRHYATNSFFCFFSPLKTQKHQCMILMPNSKSHAILFIVNNTYSEFVWSLIRIGNHATTCIVKDRPLNFATTPKLCLKNRMKNLSEVSRMICIK